MLANPWVLLGLVLALGASHLGAYVYGSRNKENAILAEQMRQEELADKFELAIAEKISQIKVTNTTIYQRATREVVKEPVYVDCIHTPDGLQLVNSALTNTLGAGGGELPGADATGGEHVRGDDPQAN